MTLESPTAREIGCQRLLEQLEKCEAKGLSQQDIAKRVGLPPQYVSDIKHGRRPMTELVARRLAAEFKCDYEWLLGTSSVMQSSSSQMAAARLPVLPHPVAGDPRESRHWDGSLLELAGRAAAQLATAQQPYILRFGVDDRSGRLRRGDLILISQAPLPRTGIFVVRDGSKMFLARRHNRGWERLAAANDTAPVSAANSEVVGCCLGIVWAALC